MKKNFYLFCCIVLVAGVWVGSAADATSPATANPDSASASSGVVNVLTPQSPAFYFLGTNPQNVSSPSSPAELGTDILQGIDAQGNAQSGLAINVVPYMLFEGADFQIDQYRQSAMSRGFGYLPYLLANTSVSLGTAKGTSSADKSLKAAIGFRTTIFDESDPRLDDGLEQCFQDVMKKYPLPAPVGPPSESPTPPQVPQAEIDDVNTCHQEHDARNIADGNWNKSAWDVGGGWSADSSDGTTSKFRSGAWGVFTTYGHPFFSSFLILHGQYLKNEQVANANKAGTFITEDEPMVSGKLSYRVNEALHVDLTAYGTFNLPRNQTEETSYGLSTGAEYEIIPNIWLQLNVGGSSATRNTKGAAFVLSQFSFSTSTAAPANPNGIN